jgi:hypothetical protein
MEEKRAGYIRDEGGAVLQWLERSSLTLIGKTQHKQLIKDVPRFSWALTNIPRRHKVKT